MAERASSLLTRSPRFYVAALAGVACAAACFFPDVGNLTVGDAGSDTGASDVSKPSDAGADAGDAGPVDAFVDARFCPQAGTILCSDFDDDDAAAALPGPWDFAYAPNATLELTTSVFRSPPRSVTMVTTSAPNASLTKSISGVTALRYSFDVYVEVRGGNLSIATFTNGNLFVSLQPVADTTTNVLEGYPASDGGPLYAQTSGPPLATGGWRHVDLAIDFPTKAVTASFDGVKAIQRTLIGDWSKVTAVNVGLGLPDSAATTIHYDNVTIR